jgi:hypothetical protein
MEPILLTLLITISIIGAGTAIYLWWKARPTAVRRQIICRLPLQILRWSLVFVLGSAALVAPLIALWLFFAMTPEGPRERSLGEIAHDIELALLFLAIGICCLAWAGIAFWFLRPSRWSQEGA